MWTDKNRDNLDHLRYRVARVPVIQLEKLVVEAIRAEAGPIRNRKVNLPIASRPEQALSSIIELPDHPTHHRPDRADLHALLGQILRVR